MGEWGGGCYWMAVCFPYGKFVLGHWCCLFALVLQRAISVSLLSAAHVCLDADRAFWPFTHHPRPFTARTLYGKRTGRGTCAWARAIMEAFVEPQ